MVKEIYGIWCYRYHTIASGSSGICRKARHGAVYVCMCVCVCVCVCVCACMCAVCVFA
jgi:hypothetical protein